MLASMPNFTLFQSFTINAEVYLQKLSHAFRISGDWELKILLVDILAVLGGLHWQGACYVSLVDVIGSNDMSKLPRLPLAAFLCEALQDPDRPVRLRFV